MTQMILIEGQNVPIDSQQAQEYLKGYGLKQNIASPSGVSATPTQVPESVLPDEPVQNSNVNAQIIENNPYLTRDLGIITRAIKQKNGMIAYSEDYPGANDAIGSTSINDTDDDNYYAALRWAEAHPEAQFEQADYQRGIELGAAGYRKQPEPTTPAPVEVDDIAARMRRQAVPIVSMTYGGSDKSIAVAAVNPWTPEEYDPVRDPWDVPATDWYGAPIPDAYYDPKEKIVEWDLPDKSLMSFTRVGFFTENTTGLDIYEMVNKRQINLENPEDIYGKPTMQPMKSMDSMGFNAATIAMIPGSKRLAGDFTAAGAIGGSGLGSFKWDGREYTDIGGIGQSLIGIGGVIGIGSNAIGDAMFSVPVIGEIGGGLVKAGGGVLGGIPLMMGAGVLSTEMIIQDYASGNIEEPQITKTIRNLGIPSGYLPMPKGFSSAATTILPTLPGMFIAGFAPDMYTHPIAGITEATVNTALLLGAAKSVAPKTSAMAGDYVAAKVPSFRSISTKYDPISAELQGVESRGMFDYTKIDIDAALLTVKNPGEYGLIKDAVTGIKTADSVLYRNPELADLSRTGQVTPAENSMISSVVNRVPEEYSRVYGSASPEMDWRVPHDADVLTSSFENVPRWGDEINTIKPGSAIVDQSSGASTSAKMSYSGDVGTLAFDVHTPGSEAIARSDINLLPKPYKDQIYRPATGQEYVGLAAEDLTRNYMRKMNAVVTDTIDLSAAYRTPKDFTDLIMYGRKMAQHANNPGQSDIFIGINKRLLERAYPVADNKYINVPGPEGSIKYMHGQEIFDVMSEKWGLNQPRGMTDIDAGQPFRFNAAEEPRSPTMKLSDAGYRLMGRIENVASPNLRLTGAASISPGMASSKLLSGSLSRIGSYSMDTGSLSQYYKGFGYSVELPLNTIYKPPSYSPPPSTGSGSLFSYPPPYSPSVYSPSPSPPKPGSIYVPPSLYAFPSPSPSPSPSRYGMLRYGHDSGSQSLIDQMGKLGRGYTVDVLNPFAIASTIKKKRRAKKK